ncbi:MAG: efflux RND transporter periplasmic adaptor subunit [Armatimonadota bacterium]|nr:efflux RND transporter periplasmic adaptor subunit [Armatimonadota bacterium]
MLTPRAEIRLGPCQADQQRLMRRASRHTLSYTLTSLWRGIVEYVFPPHGLFRRGAPLARVYDPELLSDIERAQQLMATADVSPLTIACEPRPGEPQTSTADEQPALAEPPPVERAAPASPEAPVPPHTAPNAPPDIRETVDFDLEANQREQEALRQEAEMVAQVVSAAMTEVRSTFDELEAAREELDQRLKLAGDGVLAEKAVKPARERVEKAQTAFSRAEKALLEAQQGYDRIAARIQELENEAAEAHEAIRRERERRARLAEARSRERAARSAPRGTAPAQREREAPPEIALREAPREDEPETDRPGGYPMVQEVHEIAAPRWEELTADAPGMVTEAVAPEGTLVEAGDELLRVANLQLASLTARVTPDDLAAFRPGRSVTLTFEDYPEAVFEGWVASLRPLPETEDVEVGLLVISQSGPFRDDPYLALRWMTLQAGVGEEKIASDTVQPARGPSKFATSALRLQEMFPTVGPGGAWAARVTEPGVPARDRFTGRLRLESLPRFASPEAEDGPHARRLAALEQWRASYVDGMTTTVLDDDTTLTYPAEGEIRDAVQAMIEGRVSHRPNLCALTMRQALGWGLGDAHQWAYRLPRMGYVARDDGLPRPGDILVWPFTWGARGSQHIGIAVRQGRRLMLLSNLGGRLGTTEILDGYIAFHRPPTDSTS